MSEFVPAQRNEGNQTLIPSEWRNIFAEIVEAFKDGDYILRRGVTKVRPISEDTAEIIAGNITKYGARISSLPEAAWDTSACQWMRGYWDVLIDLYTVEEGLSDLALAARVYEDGSTYTIDVKSVHVP